MNFKMERIPDKEKCLKLLEEYKTPEHVINHCMAVCKVAVLIAEKLNEKGYDIDIKLLQASAMLHDIARVEDMHETVGAEYLRYKGYPEVADIVKRHTSYKEFSSPENINETDILCIGDRTVREDEYVGVDARMEYIKEKAVRMGKDAFVHGIEQGRILLKDYISQLEKIMGVTLDDMMKGSDE